MSGRHRQPAAWQRLATWLRQLRRHVSPAKAGFDPQAGDVICDCRYRHLRIAARDGDNLTLEDGAHCSLTHCCDPPDHTWPHPVAGAKADVTYRTRAGQELTDADIAVLADEAERGYDVSRLRPRRRQDEE